MQHLRTVTQKLPMYALGLRTAPAGVLETKSLNHVTILMRAARLGAAAVLISVCVSSSARAQGVGAISGSLTDSSGGLLPGVSVSLANENGSIGGNQQTVSDRRGTYRFTGLVPGRYTVKAELQGFQPANQGNIIVNADTTTRADLKLEIGSLAEAIIVTSELPLLDTTSALNQTVLSREILDTLPSRNDLWSLGRVIPGITFSTFDVGGSKAALQSRPSVHGVSPTENLYLVDGMDTTYPGPFAGSAMIFFNPFMFEQINYQTSNRSADQATAGVSFNLVTKTGTNSFRGTYTFTGLRPSWVSNNITPALRAQLFDLVPARALARNPNIKPGQEILEMWDTAATLSGPLVRDKLWFVASGKYGKLNRYGLGNYDVDGSSAIDDSWLWDITGKLSWQINQKHQFSYLYYTHQKGEPHTGGSGVNFSDSLARFNKTKTPTLMQPKLTSTLSSRTVMSVAGSLMTATDRFLPVAGVQNGDIPRFDSVLRTADTAQLVYYENPVYRAVLLASLTHELPSHSLTVGYSLNRGSFFLTNVHSTSHYPAGLRAVFRNGVPDSVNTSNSPIEYTQYIQEHAVFVQDRWTPHRKLTLNLGGRIEAARGWQPAACQPETIFIEGQCFSAIQAPDFNTVSPRISAVYDVFGDGRTAIKIASNTYQNQNTSAYIERINPLRRATDTRSWKDSNDDKIPQLNELGPSTGFNLGTTNRFDASISRPNTNEYSLEFEQQLPGQVLFTAGFFWIDGRDRIGSKNLAVPPESYIPLNVTEVASGREVTVFNQAPSTRGRFDVLWDNFAELDSNSKSLDLSLTKRMSNRWMAFGGVSFAKNTGDIYAYGFNTGGDLNNPNFTHRRGIWGDDVPFALKASGTYEFPHAIFATASVQHLTGFPEQTTVLVNSNTVQLTQVSQSLVVEPRATRRYPDYNQLDVSIRKSFRAGSTTFEPVLDVFNVFNNNVVTAGVTQLGPAYGRARVIMDGRMVKLGGTVSF